MDEFRPIMIGFSYFTSADYLVVYRSIRAIFLYPTNTKLQGPNIYQYFKFFPGVVRHFHPGFTVVPCQQIIAVLDVTNHFVVTTFPIP